MRYAHRAELDRLVHAPVRPLRDDKGGRDASGGNQAEEDGAEEVFGGSFMGLRGRIFRWPPPSVRLAPTARRRTTTQQR